MKITELDGLKQEGSEVNLLFYIPLGKKKLHAQFYNPKNDDVYYETVIKNWNQAISAVLVFRERNGESVESLTEMFNNLMKEILAESK